MGKCYNFMFDSTFHTTAGGAGTNKTRKYATNWQSVLPENKSFKVSFTFMSESDTASVITFTHIPVLRCNLGQTDTNANLSLSATSFNTTNALGFLKLVLLPSNNVAAAVDEGYLLAEHTTNPPIYLKQRPTSSHIEVEIHNGLTNTNYGDTIPDYIFTLHFEEVDEY
jgi:hypothetical protein